VADSKLDALKKYVQSMGWNFGPSTPIQYGEQIAITSELHKAVVNCYPKNGKLVPGGPASPLRDALLAWINSANQAGALTQTSDQQGLTDTAQPINSQLQTKPSSVQVGQMPSAIISGSHIGMDESGKGDWFGPLVVAAVFVNEQTSQALQDIGVRDSKLLKATTIQHLASRIQDIIPADHRYVLTLEPDVYNELYDTYKNINLLLADAYSRAALEIWRCTHAAVIVCDQFSQNADRLESAFAAEHLPKPIQRHHAESVSIAVAAASILASAAFALALERLGKAAGINDPLPKGASDIARLEKVAQQIINLRGARELDRYAKLNFKPIQVLLGGEGKSRRRVPTVSQDVDRSIVMLQREWRVLLQKIWKEGDGREAFFLASFTLPLETSWRYMQLDR